MAALGSFVYFEHMQGVSKLVRGRLPCYFVTLPARESEIACKVFVSSTNGGLKVAAA